MTGPHLQRRHPLDFVTHLRELAVQRPDDNALIVVCDQGGVNVDTPVSYRLLDRRIRALAARLQQAFEPGDRALIVLDNGDDYVVSFFACLYAGLVAVPVFPPESTRKQHLGRLAGIAADSQARCILTHSAVQSLTSAAADAFAALSTLAVDTIGEEGADLWAVHAPAASDIAFLQYTSGSTSAPKGVMVTHGSLMANMRAIEEGLSVGAQDVFVSWLPLNHDMGLIGGLLQPIHRGIPVVLMSPRYFLERPLRWLEAISRHRGTISGGPDFAYRLCVERVTSTQIQQLDLSSWVVAFSGAEPVRADTFEAFTAHAAPAGFSAGAVYPCYGLAEATLFVTGGQRGAGLVAHGFSVEGLTERIASRVASGTTLVGCGRTVSEHRVDIVDPESLAVLAAGQIGEIWASGPSLGRGYWRKPEATRETFVERGGRTWLRTGDLGFWHEGQLYVAGRIKDMIIVRGHNLYPQDLERAVESTVNAVRKGRIAAFAVEGAQGEGIGLAAEVSRSTQKRVKPELLVEALSAAVSELCGEPLSVVLLLNPGGMPKTTSGKLQRSACRKAWLDRSADAYAIHEHGRLVFGADAPTRLSAAASPLNDTEAALSELWRQLLRLDDASAPGRDAHFFASGGNSLAAVQLAARIGERWGVDFALRALFDRPRLGEMALEIHRLHELGGNAPKFPIAPLPAVRRSGPLPLSHAQERQWFLWQLHPGGSAYHVSAALRLAGPLPADALRAAFDDLIERHESLRTVFRSGTDGTVQQVILAPFGLDLNFVDLRDTPAEARETRAAEVTRAAHATPFDLASGPLLRVALICMADEAHVLVVVMHHIISDGASMQVLIDELASRCLAHMKGATAGDEHPLPVLPIQYADYAVWQRNWLSGAERERQLAYWRTQLGDVHPLLALPTDHPRHAVADYRATSHAVELDAGLIRNLRQLAQDQGATLFMVLLAGFQALLYRYTGQADLRVGVPVANRHRTEAEGLIGFFVNTQVLRAVVHGRMSLLQLLMQTKEAALGAQAHQDLPFEQLVEALQPQRSLSHSPLFQVMFNLLREDHQSLRRLPGLEVADYRIDDSAAQFELTLDIRERTGGAVTAVLTCAAELFEPETIERMAGHYQALLAALANDPGQTLAEAPCLAASEQQQLREWAAGTAPLVQAEPVHRLIERQARQQPDAVALVFDDAELSYAALNLRANQLAHRLIQRGAKPGARIAVAVGRGADMVVGLLAALKAGGVYLPLDPSHPAQRLAQVMEDSGAEVLLTTSQLALPGVGAACTVGLDEPGLEREPGHDPVVSLHGEQLAYLIYTSGTTGRPKGVAVGHAALSMHLRAMAEACGITREDRALQFAMSHVDAAIEQCLLPLVAGAALVLQSHWCSLGSELEAMLERHRVTVVDLPPAYARQLLQDQQPFRRPVRLALFGGEPWTDEDLALIHRVLRPQRLINAYGPTEAVITPTVWHATGTEVLQGYVPIGRPVGDRVAHVLDADMQPVPVGVAGELYLGGRGLARGYWQRAAQTSQSYVANPFEPGGGRLYRTGDRVKWRPDGQLAYIERLDHQVKLRGFRIELAEIEARLREQPQVSEVVVTLHEGAAGPSLVAYVAPAIGLDTAELKERLGKVLPDYMVPSVIVALASLPLTAGGKVDRRALPPPVVAGLHGHEAAQGVVAETLAAIWAEVLKVDKAGMHDNFFDLGGNSLLLIRMHRLLEERLSAGLSVVDLFKFPTIGSLARRIEQGRTETHAAIDGPQQRALRQRAALLQRRQPAQRIQ